MLKKAKIKTVLPILFYLPEQSRKKNINTTDSFKSMMGKDSGEEAVAELLKNLEISEFVFLPSQLLKTLDLLVRNKAKNV